MTESWAWKHAFLSGSHLCLSLLVCAWLLLLPSSTRAAESTNPPGLRRAGVQGYGPAPASSGVGGSQASLPATGTQAGVLATNLPGVKVVQDVIEISNRFAGFVRGSLADVVWSGFETNGRSTRIWEYWRLPEGWPAKPPVLRWNTNNLMWGRKGMTAFSQVFEGMGWFGQGAVTALTRRHGYVRGHSMGPSGLRPEFAGRRIWFVTRDNQVIERKSKSMLVRDGGQGSGGDYSIILFDADLPATIEPMRVADTAKVRRKFLFGDLSHKPFLWALQDGFVGAGMVEGWTVAVRGGDSGSPVMLPLPGELVFFSGISTSGPSAAMQADMDTLSRRAGLDPRKYQMQWVNLDGYPDF